MGTPISYNSGTTASYSSGMFKRATISLNLQTGLVSGNNWWNGVDVTSSQYLIYSDIYSQGQSTFAGSRPTAWSTPDLNDSSLILLINTLPDRVGQPGFTTVSQAVNWLNQTGKYFLLKLGYDNIVTSNIKLRMDAGWYNSYPGSGSTWTDLSVNNYSATLYNSPVFVGNDNGVLDFDGANDYGSFGTAIVPAGSSPYTVIVWVKRGRNNVGYEEVLAQWTFAGSGNSFYFGFDSGNVRFTDSWSTITGVYGAEKVDEWMCLVGVNTGSNAYIYLNGVLMATKGSALSYGATGPLVIGRQGELNGEYFDGQIGLIQIYDTALSQTQILQNFNAQAYRYGLNNEVVTSGLMNYLNSRDVTSYQGSGTVWRDLSGNQNTATLYNGPTFDATSKGIVFDGSDDYAEYGVSLDSQWTVITVAKSTNSTWNTFAGLGSRRIDGGFIMHNNSSTIDTQFYVYTAGSTANSIGVLAPADSNIQRPHFYAMSTNGLNLHKAYIDSTVSLINATTYVIPSSSGSVFLAKDDFLARFNAMTIYQHQIYNRQLSEVEILQNYYQGNILTSNLSFAIDSANIVSYPSTNTTWYNLSSNSLNATLTNGPTYSNDFGGVLIFDGTNDYAITGNFPGLSDWSVELWLYPTVYTLSQKVILDVNLGIRFEISNAKFNSHFGNGSSWIYTQLPSTTSIAANTWFHVTNTNQSGGQAKMYVNGILENTLDIGSGTTPNIPLYIARFTGAGGYEFQGYIAVVRIYSVALDHIQVQNNFNAQKSRYGL